MFRWNSHLAKRGKNMYTTLAFNQIMIFIKKQLLVYKDHTTSYLYVISISMLVNLQNLHAMQTLRFTFYTIVCVIHVDGDRLLPHTFELHFEHTFRLQNLHVVAQAPNKENFVLLQVKHTWKKSIHTSLNI